MFLSRGDRDLGVAFQTHPGRQAFLSSGRKEARSALESRRVSLGAHWVDSRESSLLRRLERCRKIGLQDQVQKPLLPLSTVFRLGLYCGEGNGTPLQYSCLENPMDRGAWWAAVQGVTKSRTRLSDFTFTHWRRKWQPTPVFLPGESQGWGSLVGCRLWGPTESDTTEVT